MAYIDVLISIFGRRLGIDSNDNLVFDGIRIAGPNSLLTGSGGRVGRTVTSGAAVQMLGSERAIRMNLGTPATSTVTLPASPFAWQPYTVADQAGNAQDYPITVTDGGSFSYTIQTNGQSVDFYWFDNAWGIM